MGFVKVKAIFSSGRTDKKYIYIHGRNGIKLFEIK